MSHSIETVTLSKESVKQAQTRFFLPFFQISEAEAPTQSTHFPPEQSLLKVMPMQSPDKTSRCPRPFPKPPSVVFVGEGVDDKKRKRRFLKQRKILIIWVVPPPSGLSIGIPY